MINRALENMSELPEKEILNALNHEIRREVLIMLETGPKSYTQLLEQFGIASGKLNYHLKLLNGLVKKNDNGFYQTTGVGDKALKILEFLQYEVNGGDKERSETRGNDQTLDEQAQKILDLLQAKMAKRSYGGVYYGDKKTRTKATVLGLVVALFMGIMVLFIASTENDDVPSSGDSGPLPWVIFSIVIGLVSVLVMAKIAIMRKKKL